MDISPLEELLEKQEVAANRKLLIGGSRLDDETLRIVEVMARERGLSQVIVIRCDDKPLRSEPIPLGLLDLAELSESVKIHDHLHLIQASTTATTRSVRRSLLGTTRLSSKGKPDYLAHRKRGRY
jgi:hypothetical protein